MANPYIWAGLERANNDPTTIDQAIAEAVAAHDDNPDAHLGDGQSLQSHRASEIIDHRAESIVNDKIRTSARAWVAIVDPASEIDFDTIEEAIEYAISKGGGTILIMPGDHYLSGAIDVPYSINLAGIDLNSTTIHGEFSNGRYLRYVEDTLTDQTNVQFDNICFSSTAGGVLLIEAEYSSQQRTSLFSNCAFRGTGRNLVASGDHAIFVDCEIDCNTVGAIGYTRDVVFDRCIFRSTGSGTVHIGISASTYDTNDAEVIVTTCSFLADSGTINAWFGSDYYNTLRIANSRLQYFNGTSATYGEVQFSNNYFQMATSSYHAISAYQGVISGNVYEGGSGNRLRLTSGSSNVCVTGNYVRSAITNSGTNNLLTGNLTT